MGPTSVHFRPELVELSIAGDRQQAVGAGFNGQRLEERTAIRLAGLAIGQFHMAELCVLDDRRYFRDARVTRSCLIGFPCPAEVPVGLAFAVLFEENRDVAQLEGTDIHRARNQGPQSNLRRDPSDLQHLRLRAPFRIGDTDVLGQQRD